MSEITNESQEQSVSTESSEELISEGDLAETSIQEDRLDATETSHEAADITGADSDEVQIEGQADFETLAENSEADLDIDEQTVADAAADTMGAEQSMDAPAIEELEVEDVEVEGELEAPPADEDVDDDALAEELEQEQVPDDDRMWYVVHCYSGYENKVCHNLEQRIETMGMKDKIFDVVVPTEEEIEIKDGKRRTVERRVFPGYILVQMIMDEDSWYVVRNTPGVTGFVGMGNEPTPLRPEEVSQIVRRMEAEAPRIKVTFKTGQKVRIIDGPFNDFIGTVSEIDMERAKVRVMVSFFGRETPVELDFLQVEKA